MPEMMVDVRWPNGMVQQCYSPSLVMHDYLHVGDTLTVADFVDRATVALSEASERVRAKYGVACTSAAASADEIRGVAADYAADAVVAIVAMEPPLPPPVAR